MSDKEERIWIEFVKNDVCRSCLCQNTEKCERCGPTRQQAIEAMARAFCREIEQCSNCEKCELKSTSFCKFQLKTSFKRQAEAALEALLKLGGKK